MDLKQYKTKIRNQLLGGLHQQAQKEKAIEEGDYVTKGGSVRVPTHYKIPKDHYDEIIRQMSVFRGPKISMTGHVPTGHDCGGGSMYESDGSDDPTDVGGSFVGKQVRRTAKRCGTKEEEEQGGKIHFAKSMKHLGNSLNKTGQQFGTALKKVGINEASKAMAQEGVKFAKDNTVR